MYPNYIVANLIANDQLTTFIENKLEELNGKTTQKTVTSTTSTGPLPK
jgi:hypothetical protein